MLLRFFSVQ
uniref:Uncharacterized protein n=1 Tax=Arundo donax TaxID=35708 RepID=A0A0A9CA76_ARUDO